MCVEIHFRKEKEFLLYKNMCLVNIFAMLVITLHGVIAFQLMKGDDSVSTELVGASFANSTLSFVVIALAHEMWVVG